MKRLVCLFPGQGTIDKDVINKEWYSSKISQLIFEEAEKVLFWNVDTYLRELSYEELLKTNIAQPLIYTLNMAMYYTIFNSNNLKPSIFLGHSLGEYCALVANEVISFNEGLEIVKKRGELMAEYNFAEATSMASLIGVDVNQVKKLIEQNSDNFGIVDIAAYNSKDQIIISGHEKKVNTIIDRLKKNKVKPILLPVGGPFHSRLYGEVEQTFSFFLKKFTFSSPKATFISSITGISLKEPEEIKEVLSRQITSPVLWTKAIDYLDSKFDWIGIEMGSKPVLKGLLKGHNILATTNYNTLEEVLSTINELRSDLFELSAAAIKAAVTLPNKNQEQVDTILSTFEKLQQQRNLFLQTNQIDCKEIEELFTGLLLAKGYNRLVVEKEITAAKRETGLLLAINI